jgi:hypothetical protein
MVSRFNQIAITWATVPRFEAGVGQGGLVRCGLGEFGIRTDLRRILVLRWQF